MNKQKKSSLLKAADWIALIVAIFVVIGFVYKITDGNIDPSSVQAKQIEVRYTLAAYAEEASMLEHIKVGDQIAEAKRDFPLYVEAVDIVPYNEELIIFDELKTNHITQKQAIAYVTVKGQIDLKGKALRIGKQEINPGNQIFLESRLYKFSSLVLTVEATK